MDAVTLTPLEIASGTILGQLPSARSPAGELPDSPLVAVELAVLPALCRPPCLVSFSGGMDSSFVLSVATRTARRHGLPDPIPVTWRFDNAPAALESEWQDKVLAQLGIDERVILQAGDDLDFVGPVAAGFLHRYGVRYPANLYLHVPLLQLGRGGSLLTGLGGDQVLSCWSGRRRTAVGRIRALAPQWAATRWSRRPEGRSYGWLQPSVARQVLRHRRAELRSRPVDPVRRLSWRVHRRDLVMCRENLHAIGIDTDVQVVNPLLDSGFHTSLARSIDRAPVPDGGTWSRSQVLRHIAGDQLPSAAWQHRAKANFTEVFLRRHTGDFLSTLAASGAVEDVFAGGTARSAGESGILDPALIDPIGLRAEWLPMPSSTMTATLLQYAWLASR